MQYRCILLFIIQPFAFPKTKILTVFYIARFRNTKRITTSLLNSFSGVQILWNICNRLVRYLYSSSLQTACFLPSKLNHPSSNFNFFYFLLLLLFLLSEKNARKSGVHCQAPPWCSRMRWNSVGRVCLGQNMECVRLSPFLLGRGSVHMKARLSDEMNCERDRITATCGR